MEATQIMFLLKDRKSPWRISPLDRILIKKDMTELSLAFYRGTFNRAVVGYSAESGRDEIYDSAQMVSCPKKLGEIITISIEGVTQTLVFKGYQHGTFYKFQTRLGGHFIMTQKELNTLTPKEKRELRMY